MARTLSRARKVGIMVQSAEGTPASGIASADLVQATALRLGRNQQQLVRSDFGAGRSKFGFVQGGNLEADGELSGHLILPGSFVNPQHERLLRAALGATIVSLSTTVAASPAPTAGVYTLTSATGLQAGDIIFTDVGSSKFEGRPIASIAGAAVTLAINHSAAPAALATVQTKIFRLSQALPFLTIFDFLTNDKRQLEDAVVNELTFSFEDIVNFAAALIASNAAATTETEPAAPSFAGDAFARNFGDVWLDRTTATSAAFKKIDAYALAIRVANNVSRNPVRIGTSKADGVSPGERDVTLDITVPVGTPTGDNTVYRDDAQTKTAQRFFMQGSNSASFKSGENVAFHCPKIELAEPPSGPDTSAPNATYSFAGSRAFATTADDEIVIATG